MTDKQVVIIGYMGSGKTTVAQALAKQLRCKWVDLDTLITNHESRTPKEIIEQDGEAGFREKETAMLRKLLSSGAERLIAVGGGAWTIPEVRNMVVERGARAVWLDASFELCWTRILQENRERPLARSQAKARTLYDERRPIYALAQVRIVVDESHTPEQIAQAIAASLLPQKPDN